MLPFESACHPQNRFAGHTVGIPLSAQIDVAFKLVWRSIHARKDLALSDQDFLYLVTRSLSEVLVGLHFLAGRVRVVDVDDFNASIHHLLALDLIVGVIHAEFARLEDVLALGVQELVVGRTDSNAARTVGELQLDVVLHPGGLTATGQTTNDQEDLHRFILPRLRVLATFLSPLLRPCSSLSCSSRGSGSTQTIRVAPS